MHKDKTKKSSLNYKIRRFLYGINFDRGAKIGSSKKIHENQLVMNR